LRKDLGFKLNSQLRCDGLAVIVLSRVIMIFLVGKAMSKTVQIFRCSCQILTP
jgi:predicted lactoylglutathione lyase